MIRSVRLRNWRAYDQLDLDLGPGLTFIVASNGVGKSSLLEAVAWGVYGTVAHSRPSSAVAAGSESATVEVVLGTAAGDVRIQRTIKANGDTDFQAHLPGHEGVLSQEHSYIRWLESALSAKSEIAARLTMLTDHGTLSETAGEFPVTDHLAETFGVAELLSGSAEAEAVRKRSERERKKLRTAVKSATKQLDETRQQLAEVDEEIRLAESRHEAAVAAATDAQTAKRAADQWRAYRQRVAKREDELAQITSSLLGAADNDQRPADLIESRTERARHAASESRNRAAAASARAEATQSALEALNQATGVCPTCLRSLDESDTSAAQSEHEARHRALLEDELEAKERLNELEGQISNLEVLARRLAELGPPPELPTASEVELDVATTNETEAAQAVATAFAKLQQLQSRRQPLAAAIANEDEDAKAVLQQVTAFRKEALAEAARDTLQGLADHVMASSIVPLTEDVAHRWKRLFGSSAGLRLGVDGSITMEKNGSTIEFQDLSGGERVSAMLITRLLVLTASTSARFAWLDEPLERLDPNRRRALAATLSKAAESAAFDQMIITTYDEQLARQLAASRSSVQVEHVRTSAPD